MKKFYQLVAVDYSTYKFRFICPRCGKVHYGRKVPFICRAAKTISLCEQGRAMGLWQDIFNRSKVKAVEELSRHTNLCLSCGQFVCDDCFSTASHNGTCKKCETNKSDTDL